jgi:hypothetical protein
MIFKLIEHLSKDWNSPIYVFFRKTPQIEKVSDRHVHVLNVLLGNVEEKMGGMFIIFWTPVMPSPQIAFIGMPKNVGGMKQLRQRIALRT